MKETKSGVETVTESEKPEVTRKIQEHVAAMHARVKSGNGMYYRDPLFAEIFRHYDKIDMKVEQTKKGVKVTETSDDPYVAILVPSALDDSLAPPGHHVMSLLCKYYPYQLADGASWDAIREQVADRILAAVARHIPNLPRITVARQVLTPLDLERVFGLTEGDIFHGRHDLDQLFSLRPHPKTARYRTPITGLYETFGYVEQLTAPEDRSDDRAWRIEAEIVAERAGSIAGASGLPITAHRSIDEVTEPDVVVVPSMAFGREGEWTPGRYPKLIRWLGGRLADMSIPGTKPHFGGFLTDDAGNLWVRPTRERNATDSRFDVFDADGRFLGTGVSPLRISSRAPVFAGGKMYAVVLDENDVSYVVRLGVEKN